MNTLGKSDIVSDVRIPNKSAEILNNLHIPRMNGKKISDTYNALKEIKEKERIDITDKIELSNEKAASLLEINDLAQKMRSSAQNLRGSISLSDTSGAFKQISASHLLGSETAVKISVSSNAAPEILKVNVIQLATHDSTQATQGFADTTTPLGMTGTLVVQGENIAIDGDMTLGHIVASLHEASYTTKVTPHLTHINGSYYLSLSHTETGTPITVDASGLDLNGYDAGTIPPSSANTVDDLSAKVQLRGFDTVLTYASNAISDQGDGLIISLKDVGEATYHIDHDKKHAAEAIATFVEDFKNLMDRLDGEEKFRSLARQIRYSLTSVTNGLEGAQEGDLATLDQMGFMFRNNYLMMNEDNPWIDVLENNFHALEKAFGFTFQTSDARTDLLIKPDHLDEALFHPNGVTAVRQNDGVSDTLTLTLDGVDYVLSPTAQDATLFSGEDDTPFAGMTFVSTTPLGESVTMHFYQGIAERLYQELSKNLDETNGLFALEEDNMNRFTDRVEKELVQFDNRTESELEKFRLDLAKLGQVLMNASLIEGYLKAQYES